MGAVVTLSHKGELLGWWVRREWQREKPARTVEFKRLENLSDTNDLFITHNSSITHTQASCRQPPFSLQQPVSGSQRMIIAAARPR
jgi:hypothetical protein